MVVLQQFLFYLARWSIQWSRLQVSSCGMSLRFAYVEFLEIEAVQNAISLSESELHNRPLKVAISFFGRNLSYTCLCSAFFRLPCLSDHNESLVEIGYVQYWVQLCLLENILDEMHWICQERSFELDYVLLLDYLDLPCPYVKYSIYLWRRVLASHSLSILSFRLCLLKAVSLAVGLFSCMPLYGPV